MNPDNDSSNTGESEYPSGGTQFPNGGSQFGGGDCGGSQFPSGNQFPVGYPPFPGGCIWYPWPYQDGGYPPFQGGYPGAGIPLNPQPSFGDNVYQPSMDGLADRVDDFIPTSNEAFRNEDLSLSDLDISPYRVENPRMAGMGSQRERGKGVAATSSQHVGRSGCSHSEDQRKRKAASSEFQSSSAVTDVTQSLRIQGMKVLFDMVRLWAAETNPGVKKEYAFLIREMKHNLGLPTDGDDADE